MRLTTLLLIVNLLQVSAIGFSQGSRINLSMTNASIKEVLVAIENQSSYKFVYRDEDLEKKTVTVESNGKTLDEVLISLLSNTGTNYRVLDNNLVVIVPKLAIQPQKISGSVTDASTGEAIIGANVLIDGTSLGVVTDVDGKFNLDIPKPGSVVVISYLGYSPERVTITDQKYLEIKLVPDITKLDEIVVVGYGTVRKSDMTGSVTSVGSEKFAEQNVTRVDQILQGRATGVQVTSNSGAPGGDIKVRIRGANSVLGSNDPLYVIDGFVGADFNLINPNDIASVEILKDASSTAIYGSRGSNGVVIITTKGGKKGKLEVNYQGSVSVSNVLKTLPKLNAVDFATVVNERNKALGENPTFTEAQINTFRETGGTDWQKEIYRQAISSEHQLGISGGNEKTNYLVSLNILDQPGIVENTSFKRYTLRSNLVTQLNDKVSFRLNLTGANMTNFNNVLRQGSTSSAIVQALAWAPTTPAYDALGNYTVSDPINSTKGNPLALLFDKEIITQSTVGNVIGGLKYEIVKGLTLDVQYALDYVSRTNKTFDGVFVQPTNPSASLSNTQQLTLQSTNSLSFNRTFANIHKINAVVVFETQQLKNNNFSASSSSLRFPALKYDNLSQAGSFAATSNLTPWSLVSLLSRVNYSLNDKYLLTLSVRRDGSSKFRGSNKWGTFPAAALGWNLAQEDFIKQLNLLSKLKVRASWGLTGSQAINPFATESAYRNVIYAFNGSTTTSGIQLGDPGNYDLKWEVTEQKDIGVEVGFFDGRLNAEFDYFIKNTRDVLLQRPIPGYMGGGTFTSNVGEIQNKGWEFSIGANILKLNDLSWSTDFNISDVKNEVISLGDIAKQMFTGANTSGAGKISDFVYQPGSPFGSYWGVKYLGTWKPSEAAEAAKFGNVPGDARYEDLDKDFLIGASDYQIIGSGIPKTTLGWNNTVVYKNFTLNFFFQGIFGVDKLNFNRAAGYGGLDTRQPCIEEIKDRYIPGVNETSDIPAFSKTSKIIQQSTLFMESGDFVRLKNLSLSYMVPKKVLPKVGGIKVSFNATNLLTFTNYKGVDPESSSWGSGTDLNQGIDYGSYPSAKTFTLGVSITL